MSYKNIIDPLNRIEGDMAIELEIDDNNKIIDAKSLGFVYRGFENIFIGKKPFDAMRLSQRSCGVCPVSHGTAGAIAIENAYGIKIPRNAELIRDIVLCSNFVVSHGTHFYFMWGPDLVNPEYKNHALYPEILKRFEPLKSEHLKRVLREVRIPLHSVVATFGGKFPHPMHAVPGGVTCFPNQSDINKVWTTLNEVKEFIEKEILNGITMEAWNTVKSTDQVLKLLENKQFADSDVGVFIKFALDVGMHKFGESSPKNFLSYGLGKLSDGSILFKSGYLENGIYHALKPDLITEDVSSSFYEEEYEWRNPSVGVTKPVPKRKGAYSWIKAARYFGHSIETGPLARQLINGDPLITDLVNKLGVNTFTRTVARLHEILLLMQQLIKWVEEIDIHKPFFLPFEEKKSGKGFGLVEAPRGALGHWIDINDALVDRYQIITPTTWNGSPRDSNNQRGAIEQSLIGVQLASKESILEAGHIVRSFDPCISCSIHAIGKDKKRLDNSIFIEHSI